MPIFYCLTRLPQNGGPCPRIYIPQEQGGPVIPRVEAGHNTSIITLRVARGRGKTSKAELSYIIYKNPVCTSQETYYASATKTSRFMLFRKKKIVSNMQIHSGSRMKSHEVTADDTYCLTTGL
jgi:hypothetical protein